MKKSILTITLALVGLTVFSQAKLEIGVKAGANFSNTDIEGLNTDGITSFHAGAYGLIKISSIAIQPEILFSSQGSEVAGVGDFDFDYVNIPVLVKFYFPAGINLYAGPQFGILTSAEGDGVDISDLYTGSDISGAVGVGWDLPFGLNLTGRYVFGLSDISDAPGVTETRNNLFQLSAGFRLFKLGN